MPVSPTFGPGRGRIGASPERRAQVETDRNYSGRTRTLPLPIENAEGELVEMLVTVWETNNMKACWELKASIDRVVRGGLQTQEDHTWLHKAEVSYKAWCRQSKIQDHDIIRVTSLPRENVKRPIKPKEPLEDRGKFETAASQTRIRASSRRARAEGKDAYTNQTLRRNSPS